MKDILGSRVRTSRGYSLQETVGRLEDKESQLKEVIAKLEELTNQRDNLQEGSFWGDQVYKLVTKAITLAASIFIDDFSGEIGGIALLVPALAKNAYELNNTNSKLRPLLDKGTNTKEEAEKIAEYVADIKGDISDLMSAIAIAIPGLPGVDDSVGIALSLFEDQAVSALKLLVDTIKSYQNQDGPVGFIAKVLSYAGYFVGGNIVMESLELLEAAIPVLEGNGIMTIENVPSDDGPLESMQDGDPKHWEEGEIIDITPQEYEGLQDDDSAQLFNRLPMSENAFLKESISSEHLKILEEMKVVHEGLITDLIDSIQSIVEILPTELLMQADLPLAAGEYVGGSIAQFAGGNLISKLGKLFASTRSSDASSINRALSELAPILIALPTLGAIPVVAPVIKIMLDSLECIGNLGTILDDSDSSSFNSSYEVSVTSMAKELLGDAIPTAVDVADRTGFIDGLMGLGRLVKNLFELNSGIDKGEKLIEEYNQLNFQDDTDMMQLDDISDIPAPPLTESFDLKRWQKLSGLI